MHHLIVQLIIQTFALREYEPIKLYHFLLSSIFKAKYLAWASLAHNFDFLSLNSKWLLWRTCINIYVQLMPSEDILPQSSPKFEKTVFVTWQLFWAIPAQVFFHSLWVPFGHIFYLLENPYVYVLP